jgi:hypothetical protein
MKLMELYFNQLIEFCFSILNNKCFLF